MLKSILLINGWIEVLFYSYDCSSGIHFTAIFTYFLKLYKSSHFVQLLLTFSKVIKYRFIAKEYQIPICIYILLVPLQFSSMCLNLNSSSHYWLLVLISYLLRYLVNVLEFTPTLCFFKFIFNLFLNRYRQI